MNNPTYLIHHGVLGQKWGVHKSKTKMSKKQQKAKEARDEWSSAHKDYRSARKQVSKMSDAELKRSVERLKQERQYDSLQPKNINKGKNLIRNTWKSALAIATATSTALGTYIAINNNIVGISNAKVGERIKK